jgi:hypothetical protein
MRMADNDEGPLFLADGTETEVVQADSAGLPMKFILHTDSLALTFERGVGIVEARMPGPNGGTQIAKIAAARLGDSKTAERVATPSASAAPALPQPPTPEKSARNLIENVTVITEENPQLDVQTVAVRDGQKLTMSVTNTSDKLLPFHFSSGQTYDFAVIDSATGQEIWRWSRTMFFTQVTRSEAIEAKKSWKFEVHWNRRDNDLNPVPAGTYQVVGIVATDRPIESDPVDFEIK